MTTAPIDQSQHQAARVVGAAYLFALGPAVFAEFYVRGRLVAFDNTAQTAQNIVAQEGLFRLGTAANLTVFVIDAVLISALYLVLKPVRRGVALLALGWGLVETATLVRVVLTDFQVLRALSGAAYPQAFDAGQLQSLAMLSIGAHGDVYNVGLVLAGLRSTAFCYLWFESRFIPRVLAGWGVMASVLMGGCAFAFIIDPGLDRILGVAVYGAPIFLFELTMGLWLLFAGLRPQVTTAEAA